MGRDGDILKYDVTTQMSLNLTNDWDYLEDDPSFSPNGAKIIYTKNGTNWFAEPWPMYVMNADGTGNTQFLPNGSGQYARPEYSPDGSGIVYCYTTSGSGSYALYRVAADGSSMTGVTPSSGSSYGIWDPTFSPDGSKLAFSRNNGTQLVLTSLTGNILAQFDTSGINEFREIEWGLVSSSQVVPVSVSITASANDVCSGTLVTFTATPVNGGTNPHFQWKVDGINVGTNSSLFSYLPMNNNIVTCILTSNISGATGNPASSNPITMSVTPAMPVSVMLTASSNLVCQGDTVHFTAHMINAGSNAALKWFVNGIQVSGGNITNGLVALYPFNGNANDASGNGNHGVDVTATLTTDRFGNSGSAYNFAGISNPQIIRVPNSPTLQFADQATFSLWVHMNSYYGMDGWGSPTPTGFHVLFSKDFDQCCLYEGIGGLANGNFSSNCYSNGWNSGTLVSVDTVPGSTLGQWFNITYVFTPTEGRMYTNGQLIRTQPGATSFANSNNKDFYFGRLNSTWYPLNGKLDDVRFYNRALSDAEVLQLYQGLDSTFSYVPQNGDVVTCVLTATGPCLSNNPATSNAIAITVSQIPVPNISGPDVVCQGTNNSVYTTQAGMTAYNWNVTSGGTITSGLGTNTIAVAWNASGAQTVGVTVSPRPRASCLPELGC